MALTRDFKETVRARAQRDPKFRLALIEEAIESLVDGDLDGGRSILSNYINATIGYAALADANRQRRQKPDKNAAAWEQPDLEESAEYPATH
ncbi:MAG: hypothetical protein U5K38_02925 [Woeseiaceae bacterium]|nr:hypothetical protein [Woeseiaceae bacterium]